VLRGFSISVVVFAVLLGLACAFAIYRTGDSRELNQSIVDATLTASAAEPAPSSASQVLDASSSPLDAQSGPATNGVDASGGQIDLYRQQARSGFLAWSGLTMAAGLAASVGWIAFAFSRAKVVHGPQGFRSAGAAWLIGFLTFAILAMAAAFIELRPLGLAVLLAPQSMITMMLLLFILGAAGYYISTALAAPKIMLPSVPLATLVR
jgi:hypothetical protein